MTGRENGKRSGNKQVLDEEGNVDSEAKTQIMAARSRVNETQFAIDVRAEIEPDVELPEAKKSHIFAKTVKQFLIRIEPLLTADDIADNSTYYYGGEEPLAEFTLYPPDYDGYQFSLVKSSHDENALRRMLDLPQEEPIPEGKDIVFNGLKDIIEKPAFVDRQWEICVDKRGAPPNWEFKYPTVQQQVPKRVYIDAIREADTFLQSIGIGVKTGLPSNDEEGEIF